jgi:hypothetical protein
MLEQVRSEFSENGIRLVFARVSDPVRHLFRRSGFLERLGEAMCSGAWIAPSMLRMSLV